jgi:hypothetical protein
MGRAGEIRRFSLAQLPRSCFINLADLHEGRAHNSMEYFTMNKLLTATAVALVAFSGMATAGNKLAAPADPIVVPAEEVVVPGGGFNPAYLLPLLLLPPLLDGGGSSSTTTGEED